MLSIIEELSSINYVLDFNDVELSVTWLLKRYFFFLIDGTIGIIVLTTIEQGRDRNA